MLQSLLDEASGRWTGCNWRTAMGPQKLNLQGMRSSHAQILASATSGSESAAWDEAAAFLAIVESDAKKAESAARRAVALMQSGHQADAILEASKAVDLEAKHRVPVIWVAVRDAIQTLATSANTDCP
ncbi:hypothetical protein [Planctomycetes bacterium TBK1r]